MEDNTQNTLVCRGKVKSCINDLVVEKSKSSEFRISGYASKPVVDRVGDIVDVEAFTNTMDEFMQNPIMLWMHDGADPIGTWDQYQIRPDGLWLSGTIAQGTPGTENARALIKQKVVRALSIGFREIDGGPQEDGHYHIRRLRLFETSVVSVPANQAALFTLDRGGKCIEVKLLEDIMEDRNPNWDEFERVLSVGIADMDGKYKALEAQHAELVGKHAELESKLADLTEALTMLQNFDANRMKSILEISESLKAHDDLAKCIVKIVRFQAEEVTKESEAA